MPIQVIDPPGLAVPDSYAQVTVATGSRTVYVAGQVARGPAGEPVGHGDLAAQCERAFLNVAAAVRAAGGDLDDIAKLTIHVVGWEPAMMQQVGEGIGRATAALGAAPTRRAVTLLGVAALAAPDLLVEIEAVAVLP